MTIILSYVNGSFVEGNKSSDAIGKLEIDEAQSISILSFTPEAGLIARRTASRQAESVCKSGYLLDSGERVGVGTKLEVKEADKLSEHHLREGHRYNRS